MTSKPPIRAIRARARAHRPRVQLSGLGSVLRVIAVSAVAVLVIGSLGAAGALAYVSKDLPSIDKVRSSGLAQTTLVFDRNGVLLETLSHQNRTVVALNKISPHLVDATIAVEDREFYRHGGVDVRRVAIAAAYDLSHHQSALGASTITQQVIKNTVLRDVGTEKTVSRKLRELMLAAEMEQRYSKDQILELYLNTIFYGNGAYGAEAAAETYFGEHASELTEGQATFLAGLPQLPSTYNIFGTPEQREATRNRWSQVLDAMVATGKMTGETAAAAFSDEVFKTADAHHKVLQATPRDPLTAHFLDYVRQYLNAHDLDDQALYEGGLRIYTTLDLATQRQADDKVKAAVKAYRYKGVNTGSLLAMDPRTGEITAMVGSADFNSTQIRGQVNLTTVGRQPGSSFKPYTYATAIQSGHYYPTTLVNDAQDNIGGAHFSDWNGVREGWIPLRTALVQSRNLPALWTFKEVGPQKVIDFAHRLGVNSPLNPNSLTTTIGSEDLTMLEHVGGYSAFANGGMRVYPHPVTRIVDNSGHTLPQFPDMATGDRVMSPGLAYIMTDMMHGVAGEVGLSARPVAAKSGTTEAWTGAWFVGYTPDLAVGTFMGHINEGDKCNSGFAGLAGSNVTPSGWMCPVDILWGEHVGGGLFQPFLDAYYSKHRWPDNWKQPSDVVRSCGDLFLKGQLPTWCGGTETAQGGPAGSGPPQSTAANPSPSPSAGPNPGSPSPSPNPSPQPSPQPTPILPFGSPSPTNRP